MTTAAIDSPAVVTRENLAEVARWAARGLALQMWSHDRADAEQWFALELLRTRLGKPIATSIRWLRQDFHRAHDWRRQPCVCIDWRNPPEWLDQPDDPHDDLALADARMDAQAVADWPIDALDRQIVAMRARGATLSEIGIAAGVSAVRVSQRLSRLLPDLQARARRDQRRAAS